jgi:TRAP-type C4-dicarboxylate transport system substrate-binding protein
MYLYQANFKKEELFMISKLVTFMTVSLLLLVFLLPAGAQTINPSKTYSWKMSSPLPGGHKGNIPYVEFAKLVEQRTSGKVKITFYEGTLGAPGDIWDMVKNNAIQFACTIDAHNAGRVPITTMVSLPFEVPSTKAAAFVANEWLKAGYLKELTDNFKVLGFQPTYPMTLFMKNKKITKLEDLRGMKIKCGTGMQGEPLRVLGGVPIAMPGADMYMSIQTGILDGAVNDIGDATSRKFVEIIKFAARQPVLYFGMGFGIMNKETWDSLPQDIQKVIDQAARDSIGADAARRQDETTALWNDFGKQVEVYSLSKEEQDKWRQAASGITDNYVKEISAKGYPAKEALELMRKVLRTYKD